MSSSNHPPRYAERFFRWFCSPDFFEELQGDLEESFRENLAQYGRSHARRRYRYEVLKMLRPSVLRKFSYSPSLSHSLDMIRHYLTVALRNLLKYRMHSFINLSGLSLGLAGCLLIALFLWDAFSYDKMHPAPADTFRIYNFRTDAQGTSFVALVPPTFGPTLKAEFPEVKHSLRMIKSFGKDLFTVGDKSMLEENGFFAEPSLLDIFHVELIEGDRSEVLRKPDEILISASLAKKYFGNEQALGKEIQVDRALVRVAGVFQDVPEHFHLSFDFLFSFAEAEQSIPPERLQSWLWHQFDTYVLLHPNSDAEAFAAKLPAWAKAHAYEETMKVGVSYEPRIQNVQDVYLHSAQFQWDDAKHGSITFVYALMAVGIFLLLIAAINFINLSTARAERRAREVGVRKAVGAFHSQLVAQFLAESLLLALMATGIATAIAYALLPQMNQLMQKNIPWLLGIVPQYLALWIGLGLGVGVLAGIYPALVLSRFKANLVLKGLFVRGTAAGKWLRQGLVVVQFSLSILLIISTFVIYQQVNYLHNKDLGFEQSQLITFPMRRDLYRNFAHTREAFLQIPGVTQMTMGFGFPGDIVAGDKIIVPDLDHRTLQANLILTDHYYLKTFEMELVAGRDFSETHSTDAAEAFIINESAVQQFGYASAEEALGKPLHWEMWAHQDSIKKGHIIGVVKDFHYGSLHEKVDAVVLHIYPENYWKIVMRLDGHTFAQTLDEVHKTWDSFDTGYPLDYHFVDESLGEMYEAEDRLASMLMIFTLLNIFVACIGLLGLVAFAAERRTKEIGIRKVLGASAANILGLMSKDFLKLVLLAIVIASPLAWYGMKDWLQQFPYHIDMQLWMYLLAAALATIIALLTITFQALRTARLNPVKALRHE